MHHNNMSNTTLVMPRVAPALGSHPLVANTASYTSLPNVQLPNIALGPPSLVDITLPKATLPKMQLSTLTTKENNVILASQSLPSFDTCENTQHLLESPLHISEKENMDQNSMSDTYITDVKIEHEDLVSFENQNIKKYNDPHLFSWNCSNVYKIKNEYEDPTYAMKKNFTSNGTIELSNNKHTMNIKREKSPVMQLIHDLDTGQPSNINEFDYKEINKNSVPHIKLLDVNGHGKVTKSKEKSCLIDSLYYHSVEEFVAKVSEFDHILIKYDPVEECVMCYEKFIPADFTVISNPTRMRVKCGSCSLITYIIVSMSFKKRKKYQCKSIKREKYISNEIKHQYKAIPVLASKSQTCNTVKMSHEYQNSFRTVLPSLELNLEKCKNINSSPLDLTHHSRKDQCNYISSTKQKIKLSESESKNILNDMDDSSVMVNTVQKVPGICNLPDTESSLDLPSPVLPLTHSTPKEITERRMLWSQNGGHIIDNVGAATIESSPSGVPSQTDSEAYSDSYHAIHNIHHAAAHYLNPSAYYFYNLCEKYRIPYLKYPQSTAHRYTHDYSNGYTASHYDSQFQSVKHVLSEPWATAASQKHEPSHVHNLAPDLANYLPPRQVDIPKIKPSPGMLASGAMRFHTGSTGDSCFAGYGTIQLWQFLLELLTDKEQQKYISWTGDGWEFILREPHEVSRLWGLRKNKPKMNYDKLARGLRFYYEKNIIHKTAGKRYVYRFVCNLQSLLGYSPEELHTMVGLKPEKKDDD